MIIDFHTHTFPDHIAQRAISGMQQNTHARAFSDGTVGGLVRSMAEAGVDHCVTLPVATNPMKLRSMNDAAIACNGNDGLICFGAIHPDASDWKAELHRIKAAGLRGIKLHPHYQGVDFDDARYLRILEQAGELGLIVVTHAGQEIAYPGADKSSPRRIAAALEQVGPVTLVLAHMGGWKDWDQVCDVLGDTGCLFDTSFSLGAIAPLPDAPYSREELQLLQQAQFVEIVRHLGAERILFGTDSPWADQCTEIGEINSLPLLEQEKQAILGNNAKRLLGL